MIDEKRKQFEADRDTAISICQAMAIATDDARLISDRWLAALDEIDAQAKALDWCDGIIKANGDNMQQLRKERDGALSKLTTMCRKYERLAEMEIRRIAENLARS